MMGIKPDTNTHHVAISAHTWKAAVGIMALNLFTLGPGATFSLK